MACDCLQQSRTWWGRDAVGELSTSQLCWWVGSEESWTSVLHIEQTWTELHLPLGVALLVLLCVCSAGLVSCNWCWCQSRTQPVGWVLLVEPRLWNKTLGSGRTQQERRAFVSLCQKCHMYLQGVGQATRASLNLASKSNFKGNYLQISNCLLVLMLKAPCIPPVAMLSSPWNYFQHEC